MDIAVTKDTPVYFSRIIDFGPFGQRLARDRVCRKWMDGNLVARARGRWHPVCPAFEAKPTTMLNWML